MLGFKLDAWDYLTFLAIMVVVVAIGVAAVLLAGLPGRIAIARNHPDAEAVKVMGWAGLLPVVPWIQAFIWAFKPTDIVDIRRRIDPARRGLVRRVHLVVERLRDRSPGGPIRVVGDPRPMDA